MKSRLQHTKQVVPTVRAKQNYPRVRILSADTAATAATFASAKRSSAERGVHTRIGALREVALIVVTIGVLALGFMLPTLVAAIQSSVIESQTSRGSMQAVVLAVPVEGEGIVDLLRFAASGYQAVELGEADALTAAETNGEPTAETEARTEGLIASITGENTRAMQDLSLEILATIQNLGLAHYLPGQYTCQEAFPFLAIKETGGEVRLLWRCLLMHEERGSTVELILDNASETMLSCSLFAEGAGDLPPGQFISILCTYYDLHAGELVWYDGELSPEIWASEEGAETHNSSVAGSESTERGEGLMRLTDAAGSSVECPFALNPAYFSFNMTLSPGF